MTTLLQVYDISSDAVWISQFAFIFYTGRILFHFAPLSRHLAVFFGFRFWGVDSDSSAFEDFHSDELVEAQGHPCLLLHMVALSSDLDLDIRTITGLSIVEPVLVEPMFSVFLCRQVVDCWQRELLPTVTSLSKFGIQSTKKIFQ
jgi:hypothetical protein